MISAFRSSIRSYQHVARLAAAISQNSVSLHTSAGSAADKAEPTRMRTAGQQMPQALVDSRCYWIQPVEYKPKSGWLYQMVPASSEGKATASTGVTSGRNMSPKMPFKVKNGLPIRATSAYQFFFNEKYAKMKQKSPEKTSQETNKEIGQMWRESGPKEREKFEKLAAKDQERYAQQLLKVEQQHFASVAASPAKTKSKKASGSGNQQRKAAGRKKK